MAKRRTAESEALSRRIQAEFGRRLQDHRRNSPTKATQDDLADALGVTRPSVSNIERGHHRVFLDQVYVAAHRLGVPVTDLLPTMEEVFGPPAIVLAAGAGLAQDSAERVYHIAQAIRDRNDQVHSRRKRSSTHKG